MNTALSVSSHYTYVYMYTSHYRRLHEWVRLKTSGKSAWVYYVNVPYASFFFSVAVCHIWRCSGARPCDVTISAASCCTLIFGCDYLRIHIGFLHIRLYCTFSSVKFSGNVILLTEDFTVSTVNSELQMTEHSIIKGTLLTFFTIIYEAHKLIVLSLPTSFYSSPFFDSTIFTKKYTHQTQTWIFCDIITSKWRISTFIFWENGSINEIRTAQ